MATFEISGVEELNRALGQLSDLREEQKEQILTAMGQAASEEIRRSGKAAGIYDPENPGKHLLESLTLSKVKLNRNGGSVTVYFKGLRRDDRHGKKTPQGAVALYQEYGTRTQRARPFVRPALAKGEDKIIKAGQQALERLLAEER